MKAVVPGNPAASTRSACAWVSTTTTREIARVPMRNGREAEDLVANLRFFWPRDAGGADAPPPGLPPPRGDDGGRGGLGCRPPPGGCQYARQQHDRHHDTSDHSVASPHRRKSRGTATRV